MTAFATLWLPIIVATIAVFIASSILNSVIPWHKNDFQRVPDEVALIGAVRPLNIARGEYMVPRIRERADLKSAEFIDKMNKGPVMMMTVYPNGPMNMGKMLGQWFVYCLIVTALSACVACTILPPGADGHYVFHYTALVAFCSYVVALWQASIWYGRPWKTTLKGTIDGLIYALITGAIFMWLWP